MVAKKMLEGKARKRLIEVSSKEFLPPICNVPSSSGRLNITCEVPETATHSRKCYNQHPLEWEGGVADGHGHYDPFQPAKCD